MLTQINEIKQSFALDQEFVKNYGSSLVLANDEVLLLFNKYSTNQAKGLHLGSKSESETDKLNRFFDETQKLLTKLQKLSSSYLIKDAIFIESMLQVFRERKVFREALIENLQTVQGIDKNQESQKSETAQSKTMSIQAKRPIFNELKDQIICKLEEKVQSLKLTIAGLLTSTENLLSRIQSEEVEALTVKYAKKELHFGDELLEKILQKLENANLYDCPEGEKFNQSVVRTLEKIISKKKCISERALISETKPQHHPKQNFNQDMTKVRNLLRAEEKSLEDSNLYQQTETALRKNLCHGLKRNESADVILAPKKARSKHRSLIEKQNRGSLSSSSRKNKRKNSSGSYDSYQGVSSSAQKVENLIIHNSPKTTFGCIKSATPKKRHSKRNLPDCTSTPSKFNRSPSQKSYLSSRNTSPSPSPSKDKYLSQRITDFETDHSSISLAIQLGEILKKQNAQSAEFILPIMENTMTTHQALELISGHNSASIRQNMKESSQDEDTQAFQGEMIKLQAFQGEMIKLPALSSDQEESLLAPNHNSPATGRSEIEKNDDNQLLCPLRDVNTQNSFTVQYQNRVGSFSVSLEAFSKPAEKPIHNDIEKENTVIKENQKLFKAIFNKDLRLESQTPTKSSKTSKKYYSPPKTQITENYSKSYRSEIRSTKSKARNLSSKGLSTSSLLDSSSLLNQSKSSAAIKTNCSLNQSDFQFERGLKIKIDDRIAISDFTEGLNLLPLSPEFGNSSKTYFSKAVTSTERTNTFTSRPSSSSVNKLVKDNSVVLSSSVSMHVKNYLPKYLQTGIKPLLRKNK